MPEGFASCPSCGADGDESVPATRLLPDERPRGAKARPPGRRPSTAPTVSSSIHESSIDDARFVPGTILAERYRIVGLLGRGGMGEVYRADDLKLGQPVALKFLPDSLSADAESLARFHREVRIARQISHPNVCRVYDIGESEGLQFLSMEYIKGEELASLLKRFGRPPADRATEIARQICAGLAAAHKTGVLHRDLKPSNVMIDAEGGARVTDFGLAAAAEEVRGREVYAGTPAYMAPEQFAGREVSVRSDIYALGLVLYELFTGRRAYEARTAEELLRLHSDPTTEVPSPSSHVKEIDPLVERVIMRCLARDPEERPASALQVAAALPGGDPLAAALAMGETPSPEMVAAAPKQGALRPPVAAGLFGAVLLLLALACLLSSDVALYRLSSLEKSPEVLRERARELVRQFGYTAPPVDTAHGVLVKFDHLEYIARTDRSPARWRRLKTERPGAYRFWYRQSPRYLIAYEGVDPDHPPHDASGMASIFTDAEGRMTYFVAVPPQRDEPVVADAHAADWSPLFHAAGLDPAHFRETASEWIPLHESDARAAWARSDTAPPDYPARVEAAAYHGRPIYFEVIYPWDMAARQDEPPLSVGARAFGIIVIAIFLLTLIGGALLALRNLRSGRGDRRGAFRLALFLFAAHMLVWLFDAHHVGALEAEFKTFLWYVQPSLFGACFLWVLYVALEPFVRRRWPHRIISWTRLLGGDFRDPLVGRDILVGAPFGLALIVLDYVARVAPAWLGGAPEVPTAVSGPMMGLRYFATGLAWQLTAALFISFIFLFLLLLFFNITRREHVALAILWLFVAFALGLGDLFNSSVVISLLCTLGGAFVAVFPLYRYGLLAMVSATFFAHLLAFYPITSDLSAWYAGDFIVALVVCVALAAYAFHTSLAGQKLFSGKFLQD
ncbi:MAG TPA: serine/threonine-protein kinase [Pyrinomonadaceae bacterium]|nr:serine/threonine-protein kinase [Pyrinomonadaceae bacterium]